MYAITLMQPWATLAVLGLKKIETRSFNTKFRGELFIHSSINQTLGMDKVERNRFLMDVYRRFAPDAPPFNDLPFGAIIGKVNVEDTFLFCDDGAHFSYLYSTPVMKRDQLLRDIMFGNWSDGRYGWLLTDALKFQEPIPCKGALSFWRIPDDVLLNLQQQVSK